ncbi:MAG TPA: glycosyltransferase family 2 protein [Acidimicrobiales bacterium]|nr:glycosyltransferase family 2 protein [Acidimicrobiales bacterium]
MPPTFTVIIPAFSLERWDQLVAAVTHSTHQTLPPHEVIVAVDRNPSLMHRAQEYWRKNSTPVPVRVLDGTPTVDSEAERDDDDSEVRAIHGQVHGTTRRFGAGVARNIAAATSQGDVLAFLDDDAWPEPDWLARLADPYADERVVAVGGRPVPEYETSRPWWFPPEFDWVFGCAYSGLPETVAPLRHLIGANMSVRKAAFDEVRGFHSVDFDDLDLCQRLGHRFGSASILYTPHAVVHHYVSAARVGWNYFWRRCFFVNRYKMRAFNEMGEAANLHAETAFVARYCATAVRRLPRLLASPATGVQVLVGLLGIILAASGNLTGRYDLLRRRLNRIEPLTAI